MRVGEKCYDCPAYAVYNPIIEQYTKCNAEYYVSDGICKKCKPNFIAPAGSMVCTKCPEETTSIIVVQFINDCNVETDDDYISCDAGNYYNSSEKRCRPCPIRQTISVAGYISCLPT